MRSAWWVLAVALAFVFMASQANAAAKQKAEKKVETKEEATAKGFRVFTVDTVATKLGADAALTAEQKTKLEAAREELKKKYVEVNMKPEVLAAHEEIKKSEEAVKAGQTKLKEAMGGFDQNEEFKKILTGILTEAQMAVLYPPRGGAAKKEPKKDEPKKQE